MTIQALKKTKIKRLKNIDLLFELPLCEYSSVVRTNEAFRGYATTYKVELIDKKDPLSQLEASKSSIKDWFNDLLDEMNDFKYHLTVKILLQKMQRY